VPLFSLRGFAGWESGINTGSNEFCFYSPGRLRFSGLQLALHTLHGGSGHPLILAWLVSLVIYRAGLLLGWGG